MNKTSRIVFFLCFQLLGTSAYGTQITILSASQQDIANFKNSYSDDISAAVNLSLFMAMGSQYTFNYVHTPLARIEQVLEDDEPACIVNRIKTPDRIAKYHFSLPVHITPSQRLYHRINDPRLLEVEFNEKGEIKSIVHVISSDPKFKLAVLAHIKYPALIQAQIDMIGEEQIMRLSSHDLIGKQMHMTLRKRSDFFFAYPFELQDWVNHYHVEGQFVGYRIEGLAEATIGHLMCNDSAATAGFVKSANKTIIELKASGETKRIYAQFQGDETARLVIALLNDRLP